MFWVLINDHRQFYRASVFIHFTGLHTETGLERQIMLIPESVKHKGNGNILTDQIRGIWRHSINKIG